MQHYRLVVLLSIIRLSIIRFLFHFLVHRCRPHFHNSYVPSNEDIILSSHDSFFGYVSLYFLFLYIFFVFSSLSRTRSSRILVYFIIRIIFLLITHFPSKLSGQIMNIICRFELFLGISFLFPLKIRIYIYMITDKR